MSCSVPNGWELRRSRVAAIQARFPSEFFFQTTDYLIRSTGLDPTLKLEPFFNRTYRLGDTMLTGGPSDFMANEIAIYDQLKDSGISVPLLKLIVVESFNVEAVDYLTPRSWTWLVLEKVESLDRKLPLNPQVIDQIGDKLDKLTNQYRICHGNLVIDNIVKSGDQYYLIDWSFAIKSEITRDLDDFQNMIIKYTSGPTYFNLIENKMVSRPEGDNGWRLRVGPTYQERLAWLTRRYPTSKFYTPGPRNFDQNAYRNCGCIDGPIQDFQQNTKIIGNKILKGIEIYSPKSDDLEELNINLSLKDSGITPPGTEVWLCEKFTLNNPNFAVPHKYGWLVNQRLDGTLEQIFKTEPRPTQAQIDQYLAQVYSLLDRLHGYGLVHPDFHSANILYDRVDKNRPIAPDNVRLYFIDIDTWVPYNEENKLYDREILDQVMEEYYKGE